MKMTELEKIKKESNEFVIHMVEKLDTLTNKLEHQKASRLSYSTQLLVAYINELNSFE